MSFNIAFGFLIVTLIIGLIRKGKAPDVVNYYVGGRSRSSFVISGSLVATAIGGSATIGLSGIAFSKGFPAIWWLISGSISLVILGLLWAEKIRGYEVFTLPEVLEKQYNSEAVKIISSIVIVTAWTGIIAAQMIAAGKIMNIIWPGHFTLFVTVCAVLFVLYTVIGGQNAVIRTDLFQAVLIFAGILTVFIAASMKYGPLTSARLPEGYLKFPVNHLFGTYNIVLFFVFVGTSFLAGPDMYSRILSAKDKTAAKRSLFIAAILITFFAFLIVSIGIYSKMISPAIDAESSFQFLIINTLPETLQGVVFAALMAAFLSSADTCLLTSGIILTNDIVNPLLYNSSMSEKKKLFLTKSAIAAIGIVSLVIALYVNGIIKSLLLALTVYTSGIVLPVVLGFYRERLGINSYGVIAGLVTGGTASLILKLTALDRYLIWIFPAVFVIILAASRIRKE